MRPRGPRVSHVVVRHDERMSDLNQPTNERSLIAVTGVTGAVGGAVARLVSSPAQPVRLLVRDASRLPRLGEVAGESEVAVASYGARDVAEALVGVDILFMVSAAESPDRLGEHVNFVDAAARAGVRHVVYTSFLRAAPDATFTLARDHYATEEHIKTSGMAWTFLRDSFYAEMFELFADADGVIRGPGGDGRVSPVARADVARAASVVLRAPGAHAGRTYDLTGPHALDLAEIASILTDVRGRPFTYENETLAEARESRAKFDPQPFEMDAWISTYTAIASGEFDVVSDDVRALTGQSAMTYEDVVASTAPQV